MTAATNNPVFQQGHPLSGLADVQPPDPVSWWPPAPGWWLLALLSILLLGFVVWLLLRRRRRRAARRHAMQALAQLQDDWTANADARSYVVGLSGLLRRAAIQAHGREAVAGLSGEAWLAFLDRTGDTNRFTHDAGRLIAEAPYRPLDAANMDAETLATFVRDWLRANL